MDFFADVSTQYARNRPFAIDSANRPRRVIGEVALLLTAAALLVTAVSLFLPPLN